jgi:hypothetical protein
VKVRWLRSAAAVLTIALVSLMGESAAWHHDDIEEGGLAPHGVALVDHRGAPESSVHFDPGQSSLQPTCWACVLASSPTEAASPLRILDFDTDPIGITAPAAPHHPGGLGLAPSGARGPPIAESLLA